MQPFRIAPVSIDGTLSDPLWETAERVTGFVQRDPNEGTLPTEARADNIFLVKLTY